MRVGVAMLLGLLGVLGPVQGAQIFTEPFTGGSNGWSSAPGSSISFTVNVVRFRMPFSFTPSSHTLVASNNASAGAFVGNYLTTGVRAIGFSLICTAATPSQIQLDLLSGTNRVWRLLGGQACVTGRWLSVVADLPESSPGEWFESAPGLYTSVLSNVTELQVQITPRANPAITQTALLDDFALKSASAVHQVSPSFYTFPDTITGLTAQTSLTVTNQGTLPMTGLVFVVGSRFTLNSPSNYVLEAGAATNIQINFSPVTNVAHTGQVNFISNGGCMAVPLAGQGLVAPILSVQPSVLAFGPVVTGQVAQASIVVSNAGGSLLTGSVYSVNPPFTLVGGGSFSLPPASATNVVISFAPQDALFYSNAVGFLSNGGVWTSGVTGVGLDAPLLGAGPALADYGAVIVGTYSDAVFVVTNRGSQTMTGVAVASGPFVIQSGDSFVLEPGGVTTTVVRFEPLVAGGFTNELTFFSDGGTLTSRVSGLGFNAPLLALSPASYDFADQPTGSTSQASLIVSNRGSALLIGTVGVPGPNFGIIAGDSYTLLPGEWQLLLIGFTPLAVQAYSNNLVFDSNAGGSTNPLTGRGVLPARFEVSPASRDFGVVPVLDTEFAVFVVTNSGQAGLTGTVNAAGAPFAVLDGAAFALAGGDWTNVIVTFQPTLAGSFTGSVSFLSNGGAATGLLSGVSYLATGEATNVFFGLNGNFVSLQFLVTSGAWYHVEATTNLLDPAGWATISPTNRAAADVMQFDDLAPAAPVRAYRVLSP